MALELVSSWLDHKKLQIVKGVGKTPTDSFSAESDPVVIDLINGPILLDVNGWSPEIPASDTVWADSPLSDGRSLLVAAAKNVTEKMVFIISDKSYLTMIKSLNGLNRIISDCRNFWQTQTQIDPVYLTWYAKCGAGEQYALIYNIDLSVDYLDSPDPSIRVTAAIEREPYWRGIPPGANPKLWTFYVNNQAIGLGSKVLSDASLVAGSDHLINQTIQEKFEWSPTAVGLQTAALSQNWIDIPASKIPGDAPALCEFAIDNNTGPIANLYMGLTSKKYSGIGHDGISRASALNLNIGDGLVSASTLVKTIGAANDSVHSNGSAVTYTYGKRTVTGIDATTQQICWWGGQLLGGEIIKLDREFYRGTYAVFCRAANLSAAPVLTDMTLSVLIEEDEGTSSSYYSQLQLPTVNPPITNTSLGEWPLMYMGIFTLPLTGRNVQSLKGYGRQLAESSSNLRISLMHKVNVATANRILNVVDLIFMPVDEGLSQVVLPYVSGLAASSIVYDNTGYEVRGDIQSSAISYFSDTVAGGVFQEVRGQDIFLKPNVDQRLYITADIWRNTGIISSLVNVTHNVRLNIVPRWAGIRDV